MPRRCIHTAQDIADLATRLRETWSNGQILRSWLRTHANEILELLNDKDWSWENLGRALTAAGITYQTGTPWTGENLRRNLKRAQMPGKRELKLLRMQAPEPDPPMPPMSPAPISQAPDARQNSTTPEFQLIRRAVDTGTAPVTLASLPPRRTRPALSDEEIHAIAMGRSAKR